MLQVLTCLFTHQPITLLVATVFFFYVAAVFCVLTTHCHRRRRRRQSLMSLINSTSAIHIEFNLSFLILFSFCYRFLLNLENMISFLRRVFLRSFSVYKFECCDARHTVPNWMCCGVISGKFVKSKNECDICVWCNLCIFCDFDSCNRTTWIIWCWCWFS